MGSISTSKSFYTLGSGRTSRTYYGDLRGWYADASRSTHAYVAMKRAQYGIELSRVFEVEQLRGGSPGDFCWVSLCPIISPQAQDVFREAGITGWSTYPVSLRDKQGVEYPGYSGLSVLGRCDWIRLDKSSTIQMEAPSGKTMDYYYRLMFDRNGWDGSDIFMARDHQTLYVLASERVKQVCDGHKLTGLSLEPLEEFRMLASHQTR